MDRKTGKDAEAKPASARSGEVAWALASSEASPLWGLRGFPRVFYRFLMVSMISIDFPVIPAWFSHGFP